MSAPSCSCSINKSGASMNLTKLSIAGGLLTSLGICAACCLLPVALIALGVSSAWAGSLESLAPYKWILVVATLALLGYGFYSAYLRPRRCAAGPNCASCGSSRSTRVILWVGIILAVAGFAFEYIEPMLAP